MKPALWQDVVSALMGGWPGQKLDREQTAALVNELQAREVAAGEALAAVREYRGQFIPSAGTIGGMVDVHRQGPAPGWREANRIIARHITMLPYHDPKSGWEVFIETLAAHHEAIARFAVALGVRGVREKPDPDYPQEDTGASVALTHLEREYRQVADGWRADPRRGVALGEARRMAVSVGGSMRDVVEGLRPAGELESGEQAA